MLSNIFGKNTKKLELIDTFFKGFKLRELDKVELKELIEYKIPEAIYNKTKKQLNLSANDMNYLILDFFDFMQVLKENQGFPIDMINEKTDVLWHNLILDTKEYLDFCINYIGFFIHHTPFEEKKGLKEDDLRLLALKYRHSQTNSYKEKRDGYINNNRMNNSETNNMSNTLLTIILLDNMLENKINNTDNSNNHNELSSDSSSSSWGKSSSYSSNDSSSSSCSSCSSGCGGGS